jgi:Cu-Zn family superoxide dismutase
MHRARTRRDVVIVAMTALTGCVPGARTSAPGPFLAARGTIVDPANRSMGTVIFEDTRGGLRIVGTVSGLGLGGHAVHLHTVGRCVPPFASAGVHYNPERRSHGLDNRDGPHAGDLVNIRTPAAGPYTFELLASGVRLAGLLDRDGAALVFHSASDDHRTDPEGNSGARIGCAVIVRASPGAPTRAP